MHIVIADRIHMTTAYLNGLERFGTVDVYDDIPTANELCQRLVTDADVAVVGWSSVPAEVLKAAPRLRLVALWATGSIMLI